MNSCKTWFYTHPDLPTPISVTHEDLKRGSQQDRNCKKSRRRDVNLNLKGNQRDKNELITNIRQKPIISSTYRRHYISSFDPICPRNDIIDSDIDPLFYRRPVNYFEMRPWAPSKFMDDHFSRPSEERKRINFFRQIRQISYLNK